MVDGANHLNKCFRWLAGNKEFTPQKLLLISTYVEFITLHFNFLGKLSSQGS